MTVRELIRWGMVNDPYGWVVAFAIPIVVLTLALLFA